MPPQNAPLCEGSPSYQNGGTIHKNLNRCDRTVNGEGVLSLPSDGEGVQPPLGLPLHGVVVPDDPG